MYITEVGINNHFITSVDCNCSHFRLLKTLNMTCIPNMLSSLEHLIVWLIFSKIDTNDDGDITEEEFFKACLADKEVASLLDISR